MKVPFRITLGPFMKINVSDVRNEEDDTFAISQLRTYNVDFPERDLKSLRVFVRDADSAIVGGLLAETYWQYPEGLVPTDGGESANAKPPHESLETPGYRDVHRMHRVNAKRLRIDRGAGSGAR